MPLSALRTGCTAFATRQKQQRAQFAVAIKTDQK